MTQLRGITNGLLVTLITLATAQVTDKKCVPGQVQDIVYDGQVISWKEATNPDKCTIIYYILSLESVDSEKKVDLVPATITNYTIPVDDLDTCEEYMWSINALTDEGVEGPIVNYNFTTILKDVHQVNINHVSYDIKENVIDLLWELASPKVSKCVSHYDIAYSVGGAKQVQVYETETEHEFKNTTPCAKYNIEVTPIINDDPPLRGQTLKLTVDGSSKVLEAPTLNNVKVSKTTAQIVYETQSFKSNSCKILHINLYTPDASAPYHNRTVSIDDSTSRPLFLSKFQYLSPSTTYTTYITFENEAGWSEPLVVRYTTLK